MKIVVLDGYTLNPGDNPWDGVAALGDITVHERTEEKDIVSRAQGADVLLVNKTPLSKETLDQLPDLKFIAVLATGYNIIDIEAAKAKGIPVSNVPIYGTDTVGQYVFALLLECCHHVQYHADQVKGGEWQRRGDFSFWDFPIMELRGKTMGIVGFGRIGQRTGELARAFGMEVIAYDVYQGNPPSYPFSWKSMEELFAESDVISLHSNLTPENTGFVNGDLIGKMKKSAFIINTSRGPLINESDLADALNSEAIAGAALDVVSVEPIEETNPLFSAKNCIITPHIAWATVEARRRLMQTTVDNIEAFIKKSPINVVNK